MDRELNSKEKEKMKNLLKGLREVKISDGGRKVFISKLDKIPMAERGFKFTAVKERLYYLQEEMAARIEGVFARPVPAYARAAFILIVSISLYVYGFLPQTPVIGNIKGTVKVYDPNRNIWYFAKNNQRVGENDIIKTFQDGGVDINLSNIYSIRMKRESEIKVAQLSSRVNKRPVAFEVAKGKIFTYYNGQENRRGREFEVKTDQMVASVVGTDFMVEAMPQLQKTWLGVLDGTVRVRSTFVPEGISTEAATVYIKSRYKTEVVEGGVPQRPQIMMEDEWLQLEELYSIGKKPQVALLISTGATRTRELLSMVPLYISDKKPSILPARLTKAADIFNKAFKEGSIERHVEAIREFEDVVKNHPNPIYDVQFMLFIGAYYEYIGDHEKAIETFNGVILKYPKSNLASIALCAIGIIYEEKLNDKEKAIEAYKRVISQYPQTPETEEALSGLKRLQ